MPVLNVLDAWSLEVVAAVNEQADAAGYSGAHEEEGAGCCHYGGLESRCIEGRRGVCSRMKGGVLWCEEDQYSCPRRVSAGGDGARRTDFEGGWLEGFAKWNMEK